MKAGRLTEEIRIERSTSTLNEYGTSHHEAQPFFWPGFRMGRKRALNRIKRAIGKAIREAK